jgi:hypothetical protein
VPPPLRFLLDQGFPKPRFDVHALDGSVEYVHLVDEAPELSRSSTPDWMLYLVAEQRGFAGLVTDDVSQIEQDTELIALTRTHLTVVTWDRGGADPVVRWAQLLVYMPKIVKARGSGDSVVVLPNPALGKGNVRRASDVARSRSARDRQSYPERRDAALALMRAELAARGRDDLVPLLAPARR